MSIQSYCGSRHRTPSNRTPRLKSALTPIASGAHVSSVSGFRLKHPCAPYLLAYGNASVTRAEADFSRLPTSLDIAPATLSSLQALGGASRLIAKPAQFPWDAHRALERVIPCRDPSRMDGIRPFQGEDHHHMRPPTRSTCSGPPSNCVIDDQHDDGTDDRHQDAVKIHAADTRHAKGLE